MRISYGIDDMSQNESFIHAAESLVDSFGDSITPGKYLVNSFPILKHVPDWAPGAGFQKTFRKAADLGRKAVVVPYTEAKIGLVRTRSYCSLASTRGPDGSIRCGENAAPIRAL